MNLGDMKTELLRHVGKPSIDAGASAILTRAVNVALNIIASVYEPKDVCYFSTSYIAVAYPGEIAPTGGGVISMTRYSRIQSIYSVDGNRMWPLSLDDLSSVWIPADGIPRYYAVKGNAIWTRPFVTEQKTVFMYYAQYPEYITQDSSTVIFEEHYPLVMSIATEWYWATQEEAESQATWAKMSDKFGFPDVDMLRAQKNISKGVG